MRLATCSVGLVSPRSTWLSIGALTPRALGEVAQREVHRLAQRAHARADVDVRSRRRRPRYKRTLSHTAVQALPVRARTRGVDAV